MFKYFNVPNIGRYDDRILETLLQMLFLFQTKCLMRLGPAQKLV